MFSFVSKVIKSTLPTLGSIYVRLDKGDFYPGEQISGTILLDLYTNWSNDRVYLTIVGIEQTKVVEQKQDPHNNNKPENIVHEDSNPFFSNQVPVYQFPGGSMPAGQYTFPFTFILQQGIPSSFSHFFKEHGTDCYAAVVYEMRASLESGHNSDPALQFSVPFNVSQPAALGTGMTKKEIDQKIKSCCCIDKGQSKLTTYFEKSEYLVGEPAYMIAEVDNTQSKAKINKIEGIFKQELTIRAKNYTHNIHRDINTYTLSGIGPGESRIGGDALRLQMTMGSGGSSGDKKIQSTCTSKLITNHYYLIVRSEMDACICCGEHPNSKLQLNLRNPPVTYTNWSGMPSTWNPRVMQPTTIQFTQDTAYDSRRNTGIDHSNAKTQYAEIAMPVFPGSGMPSHQQGQPGMPSMPGMPVMPGMP